jgi:transcription-repair coupling factor (superfamily II helicase)
MSDLLQKVYQQLLLTDDSQTPAGLKNIIDQFDHQYSGTQAEIHGCWGSLPRLIAAILHDKLTRPVLFVTAHIPDSYEAQDDLETFLKNRLAGVNHSVELFPAHEIHEADFDPTGDVVCERLRIYQSLNESVSSNTIFVAPIAALMQPVPNPSFLQDQSLTLQTGQIPGEPVAPPPSAEEPTPPEPGYSERSEESRILENPTSGMNYLIQWLIDQDFQRVDRVDLVGEFAARGGIIDIYPPGIVMDCHSERSEESHNANSVVKTSSTVTSQPNCQTGWPVRIEFFGDEIESIRLFDIDTQRSAISVEHITLTGCRKVQDPKNNTHLLEYLPKNCLIVLEESTEITEVGRLFRERTNDSSDENLSSSLFEVESILKQAQNYDLLHCNRFVSQTGINSYDCAAQSLQRFEGQSNQALNELLDLANENQVYFFCESAAQQQRIQEILESNEREALPAKLHTPVGLIHHGFALPQQYFYLVSHHEIFAQHQQHRRIRKVKSIQAIDTFSDLEKGDLVVHVNHGIGRFRGLKTLDKNDWKEEFLTLEFAKRARVHVPANQIHLVHKYVGCKTGRPKLARLGSTTWEKQKAKVTEAVESMAAELIEIQAIRQTTSGISYPLDTTWQREFEQSFPYQDTDDQTTANNDIKKDMHHSAPMDRLLCGDVGYGKTELAIRAAFKAVEHGKQILVLVPTTVLADQHFRTFTERLADFPFNVEVLSRFKTPKQAKQIIKRLTDGQIDILIGTHRILSGDIRCKDLGLVVIDEEQRFGVEHKERLKKMRSTVDVLTMTATPIPRTLHLALLGIRNISSLRTPPLDRRSIVTEIVPYNQDLIRRAILRELARDGQIYFVHNRVYNIQAVADSIQKLVPEARVLFAHGQLSRSELETRMLDFVHQKADVLVCTTIIESGLDIPNCNTILINDADRFGLAELHQLRGRVGRYKNRAFAYMLLPKQRTINPVAVKRLKAIEEYSQLGAGFRIALRDLEIRGAGNILGAEQSGHIDAVGYEMYCQLMATAVRRHQELPVPMLATTHLELNLDCHIPRSYIASDRQRLDVYRRLVAAGARDDLDHLENDLIDLFGKPPTSVAQLLQLAEIRLLAWRLDIRSIIEKKPDLIFSVDKMTKIKPLLTQSGDGAQTSKRTRWSIPDEYTAYLRLPENYFDTPTTLLAVLRKLLSIADPQTK